MDIRFLGHAGFTLSDGDTTVLIDPFLTGNPKAAVSADEVEASTIVLSHGHGDHVGDTVAVAKRTGAPLVAITIAMGVYPQPVFNVTSASVANLITEHKAALTVGNVSKMASAGQSR